MRHGISEAVRAAFEIIRRAFAELSRRVFKMAPRKRKFASYGV
jgi:hypothetical protein